MIPVNFADLIFACLADNLLVIHVKFVGRAPHWNSQDARVRLTGVMNLASAFLHPKGVLILHYYENSIDTTKTIHAATCTSMFSNNVKYWNYKQVIPTTIEKE
jgi:hypothetical protein